MPAGGSPTPTVTVGDGMDHGRRWATASTPVDRPADPVLKVDAEGSCGRDRPRVASASGSSRWIPIREDVIAHARAVEATVTGAGIVLEHMHHGDGVASCAVNGRALRRGDGSASALTTRQFCPTIGSCATTRRWCGRRRWMIDRASAGLSEP